MRQEYCTNIPVYMWGFLGKIEDDACSSCTENEPTTLLVLTEVYGSVHQFLALEAGRQKVREFFWKYQLISILFCVLMMLFDDQVNI